MTCLKSNFKIVVFSVFLLISLGCGGQKKTSRLNNTAPESSDVQIIADPDTKPIAKYDTSDNKKNQPKLTTEFLKLNPLEQKKELVNLVSTEFDTVKYRVYFHRTRTGGWPDTRFSQLINKETGQKEFVLFFDDAGQIENRIDLIKENPFLKYTGTEVSDGGIQNVIAYHKKIEENTDLNSILPKELREVAKYNSYVYLSCNVGAQRSERTHYKVQYDVYLNPAMDVEQDISIPKMSITRFYDMNGEFLVEIKTNPGALGACLTKSEKYVVYTHHKDFADYKYMNDLYKECVSVLEIESNKIVYQKCIEKNEISAGKNENSGNVRFGYWEERNPHKGKRVSYLIDDKNKLVINIHKAIDTEKINSEELRVMIYPDSSVTIPLNNNPRIEFFKN